MSSKGRDPGVPMRWAALQAQCAEWNKAYPVGTEVIRTDHLGEEHLTKTTVGAYARDSDAVIWLEEIKGQTGDWISKTADGVLYRLAEVRPRKCRVCDCTTFHGCKVQVVDEFRLGDLAYVACHWVEPDLCSACEVNPNA